MAVGAGFVISIHDAQFSLWRFVEGLPNIWRLVTDMFPPDVSRMSVVLRGILETFQMAVVGTAIGVLLSLPIAVLARGRIPQPDRLFRHAQPGLLLPHHTGSHLGAGPFAGTLALIIDTIGCAPPP